MSKGVHTLASISRALDKERADYEQWTVQLRSEEPDLARNLNHWKGRDLDRARELLPDAPEGFLSWFNDLLERYFLRGIAMQREAINIDLERSMESSDERPDTEEPA